MAHSLTDKQILAEIETAVVSDVLQPLIDNGEFDLNFEVNRLRKLVDITTIQRCVLHALWMQNPENFK